MKGICHMWSRGRHFSPSVPGDRYLNLGSKSDHRVEISGNIVWYDALAPRPEVLRSFSSLYANNVFWVFLFTQALIPKTNLFHTFKILKNDNFEQNNYNRLVKSFIICFLKFSPRLIILLYCSLRKMAIFAAFQIVIFRIWNVFS